MEERKEKGEKEKKKNRTTEQQRKKVSIPAKHKEGKYNNAAAVRSAVRHNFACTWCPNPSSRSIVMAGMLHT